MAAGRKSAGRWHGPELKLVAKRAGQPVACGYMAAGGDLKHAAWGQTVKASKMSER
jgi:hypothetical protein